MQTMTAKAALGTSPKKYRVYVVDDHPIVRQGLGLMINREADMFVCGEAEEAHSALQALTTLQPTYAERAIRAGANGYIMKQEATEKVLVAIRRILNGGVYLSDRIAGKMLQQYVRGAATVKHSPMADLSDRELEVFRLIGDGHATRQIAEELHISVKTVETYQAHIKEKLSLRNARELMQHAIEWNLTERVS
jgi:DNA-binding NarL/FixJ family response regulator